jgi:hypothetical protein
MASPSEILGLFTSPQQYQQQQQDLIRQRAIEYAKLDPFQKASAAISEGSYNLAGAIGGALGGVDPQLQKITQRQQLLTQLDRGNPESYKKLAKLAAQNGDPEFAMALSQELTKLQESSAGTELKLAQADKARNWEKTTTESATRRNFITGLEKKFLDNPEYKPTNDEVSQARYIISSESKTKTGTDASGQLLIIQPMDFDFATPNVMKFFGKSKQQEQPTSPVTGETTTIATTATTPVAGATTTPVTTPTQPTSTQIAPGVTAVQTPASIAKAKEEKKKEEADIEEKNRAIESFDDQISAVQSLRDTIKTTQGLVSPMTTGYGSYLSALPLTQARTLEGNTKTIKNNVALSKLRELKQQSSTGASGLGALNMKEFDAIQGIIASLDPMSANYKNDLAKVDEFFARAEDLMIKQSGRAKQKLGIGSGTSGDIESKVQSAVDRAMKDPRTKGTRAEVEAVIRKRLEK